MLMEADMRNGEIAKIICEQHDKEVIFGVAIQAIAIVMAKGQPTIDYMNAALALMQELLDRNGLQMATIIAADNAKA